MRKRRENKAKDRRGAKKYKGNETKCRKERMRIKSTGRSRC